MTDLVMDVMDRLYELYVADFEELVAQARQIAEEDGTPNPDRFWAQQLSAHEFRAYLLDSSRQSQAKRWFLRRLLRGREELQPKLPTQLIALLGENVLRSPHFLETEQRSRRR
jgi:hypothetical protein